MVKQASNTTIIILAAGKGSRMKSDKAKVLHTINGKAMINYVVDAARPIVGQNIVVVVGHQKNKVIQTVLENIDVSFAIQEEQLGTGHAVMCAMPHLQENSDSVVILCGDVPLISPETLDDLILPHAKSVAELTVLAVNLSDPFGYGRVVQNKNGTVLKIVEEADADEIEKNITLINSGIYCVNKEFLATALTKLRSNNSQSELYLTDIVGVGHGENRKMSLFTSKNSSEVIGVNTIHDLNEAKRLINVLN